MKTKLLLFATALILVISIIIAGCAAPAPTPAPAPAPTPAPAPAPAPAPSPSEPITIKAVTFLPKNNAQSFAFKALVERINEAAAGQLTIDWLGGPEIIGMFEQGKAVKDGVVDMSYGPAAFYAPIVPGPSVLSLSKIGFEAERETGVYDLLLDLHKDAGLFLLGRGVPTKGPYFYLFTNKYAETPYDLIGQTMGSGVIWDAGMKELGIAPVTMDRTEIYSALDRGIIDGTGGTLAEAKSGAWAEVMKYVIIPPFFVSNITNIINLNTWNQIPKDLQDLLIETQIQFERDWANGADARQRETLDWLLDAGMETLEFSPSDAEWYHNTFYRAEWEKQIKKLPGIAPMLRELLSK